MSLVVDKVSFLELIRGLVPFDCALELQFKAQFCHTDGPFIRLYIVVRLQSFETVSFSHLRVGMTGERAVHHSEGRHSSRTWGNLQGLRANLCRIQLRLWLLVFHFLDGLKDIEIGDSWLTVVHGDVVADFIIGFIGVFFDDA